MTLHQLLLNTTFSAQTSPLNYLVVALLNLQHIHELCGRVAFKILFQLLQTLLMIQKHSTLTTTIAVLLS